MRDLVVLFVHLVVTIARLTRPGGIRSVVAESILIKHLSIAKKASTDVQLAGADSLMARCAARGW